MSGAGLRLLRFCSLKRIIIRVVSLREQLFQTARRLAGNILNGDALTDVGSVVRMALRGINVPIPDELVIVKGLLGFLNLPITACRLRQHCATALRFAYSCGCLEVWLRSRARPAGENIEFLAAHPQGDFQTDPEYR